MLQCPHGWHADVCIVRLLRSGNIAQVTADDRLPILPDRDREAGSCSPLEGDGRPPRRQLDRTRKGPVFLLRCAGRDMNSNCAGVQAVGHSAALAGAIMPEHAFRAPHSTLPWRGSHVGPPFESNRARASRCCNAAHRRSSRGAGAAAIRRAGHRWTTQSRNRYAHAGRPAAAVPHRG